MINWNSIIELEWDSALAKYNSYLKTVEKSSRDSRVATMNFYSVMCMSDKEFYNYLINDFFKWKYTAPNRYASTTKNLEKMTQKELGDIKRELVNPFLSDEQLLDTAHKIKGLGYAGATALLSILYPNRFGTVDQFVVKNLQKNIKSNQYILKINPNNIKRDEALYIIKMMQEKAKELNYQFNKVTWTPRTVDKAVWADR